MNVDRLARKNAEICILPWDMEKPTPLVSIQEDLKCISVTKK